MDEEIVRFKKLDQGAVVPTRAHADDAGLDLYGLEDAVIESGAGAVLKTGIAAALPQGCVGLVADRSSLARRGLKTAGGVIDAGYRGEIGVIVWNLSKEPIGLKKGERIAQLLILPAKFPLSAEAEDLEATHRGSGGFGSTGS